MIQLLITLIVGLFGGITALSLKVPAGAMVGSMFATAIFNVATGDAFLPQNIRVFTQIAAGAFIGAGIKRKDISDLKLMIKPAVLMVSSMITLDILMGYIMYRVTGIDLVTSLFACAPGGIVDMSLISSDLGADSSRVAVLHMVRIISVMALLPSIIKIISSKIHSSGKVETNYEYALTDESSYNNKKLQFDDKEKNINLLITMLVALTFGGVGYVLKVPAGAMTFSMAAVGALNVFVNRGYMPLNLRRLTQIFAGILIGERMTYGDILALKNVMIPALILLVGIIIVNLCIGMLVSKTSRLEMVTSLLASAPGGVSDMAIIAKELGGDAPKVAILQLARYICVIAVYPIIVKYLCMLG